MINWIIKEIRTALDNNLYILALMGALTLIDSCGKAEYPNDKVGERYKKWYDKNISHFKDSGELIDVLAGLDEEGNEIYVKDRMPCLTGEVVYSLRCALLHEDNPNIKINKIANNSDKITKFILEIESKNKFDIYVNSFGISYTIGDNVTIDREYHLSIRGFCLKVCQECEKYYNINKSKFDFNYNIWDLDKMKDIIKLNENR